MAIADLYYRKSPQTIKPPDLAKKLDLLFSKCSECVSILIPIQSNVQLESKSCKKLLVQIWEVSIFNYFNRFFEKLTQKIHNNDRNHLLI